MGYDVIIIGGGLGGLTAGAKLAIGGKKVLLIEQHNKPGGCATTFRRNDYIVEVGLHAMDGLDEDDIKPTIFRDLKVFDNLELVRVPEFYRFVNERVDIAVPDNAGRAIETLIRKFPEDEKGIRKFFKVIVDLRREVWKLPREKWKVLLSLPIFPIVFPKLVAYQNDTLGNFLDSIVQSEDLKLVLLGNLGYYHNDPYTMSMLYYAAGQGSYYAGGGWYIKGGSQKLSDYLSRVITDNGGEVILNHLVTKILTENNRAVGVEYKRKVPEDSRRVKVFARDIIANAAIPNVANHLLSPEESRRLRSQIDKLEIACSLLTVYLGFKKPVRELGNRHYSTFVFDPTVRNQSDFLKNSKGDFRTRGFCFVDYSQIDSGLTPEGKSLGVITTYDYISDWEKMSSHEYGAKKKEVAQILIARLNNLIPGIKKEIEYSEVGTAKTINRYTLNPGGTAYGYAEIPGQAGMRRIPQKSPIRNLYFASAWTFLGGGFSGVIASGYFCAEEILRRRNVQYALWR
jgi:all-trans-retinol 13,14-reductase